MFWTRLQYIHNNPVKAGIVTRAVDYKYSSARNYVYEDHSVIYVDTTWGGVKIKKFSVEEWSSTAMEIAATYQATRTSYKNYGRMPTQLEVELTATKMLLDVANEVAEFFSEGKENVSTEKSDGTVSKIEKERKTLGVDGGKSKHIIEKVNGKTNSVTHQVVKDGKIVHQHQKHIGKYGGEREFPDKWIENEKID